MTMINREKSPINNISRTLLFENIVGAQVTASSRKRSCKSRPSLEDDLKRDLEVNKENVDDADFASRRRSRKCSRTSHEEEKLNTKSISQERGRGLSVKSNTIVPEVFRYPSPRPSLKSSRLPLPTISVHNDDDDVFETQDSCHFPPPTSKLLLSPSTARTPRIQFSSTSSQYLSTLLPSPNIDRGVCCSTPNRIKLESQGLSSTEKMVLGRGAYGTVVLGKWKGKKVAIKVIEKEDGGRTMRRRKSLESEIQAMNLEHKNIVRVYDVFAKDNQHAVIIMEYVGSRNLHRLLIESEDKYLDPRLLLSAGKHVSSALAYCHSRGIIHLDVKPANVLVNSQAVFKLGDFGCSVSTSNPDLEVDHSLVGTPGYQAPEFLRGFVPSPSCDIYSLAILLWQLDSRKVPFDKQHPQTVMYQVVAAGVRPRPPVGAESFVNISSFMSLYKSCWNPISAARPSAKEIVGKLESIIRQYETKPSYRFSSKDVSSIASYKSMRL